ncbi:hypothetical protein LN650_29245 [Klebsiella pneumoniae subsp. pneumoniae]|nr:hypothetical protein [Klebsiella pneumoniae subsp. pneumoniae]
MKATVKGTIAPFDLQVRPGEIVGLAGLLGSGRTETAEVIFGIKTADSGKAWIKRQTSDLALPASGVLPRDRLLSGGSQKPTALSPLPRCGKISFSPCRRKRGWLRPIPRREQNEIAERFIRQLGIRTPSAEQPIEFSLRRQPAEGAALPLAADQTAVPNPR